MQKGGDGNKPSKKRQNKLADASAGGVNRPGSAAAEAVSRPGSAGAASRPGSAAAEAVSRPGSAGAASRPGSVSPVNNILNYFRPNALSAKVNLPC